MGPNYYELSWIDDPYLLELNGLLFFAIAEVADLEGKLFID